MGSTAAPPHMKQAKTQSHAESQQQLQNMRSQSSSAGDASA
jgi:hypothetical protein